MKDGISIRGGLLQCVLVAVGRKSVRMTVSAQEQFSRKLRNEQLNDLCCSPNIVLVIKSRRMRRAGM